MGDDDRDEGPSLELPSWRLRRRHRSRRDEASEQDTAPAAAPPPPAVAESTAPAPPAPPLFVDEAPTTPPAPSPVTPTVPAARSASSPPAGSTRPVSEATPADGHTEPAASERGPRRTRPGLGGMPAAVLTGVVVGLVTVGLTWGSQRGCAAVRGTSTCGGGPGFLLLVAIMVAMVFLGAALLRLLGVSDHGSTSVLAMGLLAVITMLFFTGVIFAWWMAIAIPVCAGLTYALSHWVTATYAGPES